MANVGAAASSRGIDYDPLRLLWRLRADGRTFNRHKDWAIAGLTLGFLVWQFGFMTIGGEWFGMWMSQQWNSVPSAFRFAMIIMAILIFVEDLAAPRARVRMADLLRQGGERPLNLAWSEGQPLRVVLLDPRGTWAQRAPTLELALG